MFRELLLESRARFPEAVNDIEAVDLNALAHHKLAMQEQDKEIFQSLSSKYRELYSLYKLLLNNVSCAA